MSALQRIPITSKFEVLPWHLRSFLSYPGLTSHPQVVMFPSIHFTLQHYQTCSLFHHCDFAHSGPSPWNSLCLSVTGKLQLTLQRPPRRGSHWRSIPCLPALVLWGGHSFLWATFRLFPCSHAPFHYRYMLAFLSSLQRCELCKSRDQVLASLTQALKQELKQMTQIERRHFCFLCISVSYASNAQPTLSTLNYSRFWTFGSNAICRPKLHKLKHLSK